MKKTRDIICAKKKQTNGKGYLKTGILSRQEAKDALKEQRSIVPRIIPNIC
ncbi:MAG: hypothetical protein PQJ59_16930 [Spirochaetales bacterium]|nr:hypothetical protein [Spirochaetales bacterium]